MDKRELQIIQELMDELKGHMEFGEDDFSERLGRKKPDVEIVKVDGKLPTEGDEESHGEDLDSDMEVGESPDHGADIPVRGEDMEEAPEEISPEESLKRRLLNLRK